MQQKEVKIIALKVNERFGILQSFECEFDSNDNLIIIKGEVGSGKTTLRKSLNLGTYGSETLKDDKQLYGKIDQEVQLLDGDTPIYVGCKSDKKGKLVYVIYTKDDEGKIVKDPVVDGVKLTPSVYLKSLQTALTWRMDELTSENTTVQKKLLLELYKADLAKAGVIFDKSDENYLESILGRIEIAENERSQADYERKKVGGFAKHLEPMGIYMDQPDTLPSRKDLSGLEKDKNKLTYDLENIEGQKEQSLKEINVKADEVVVKLKAANVEIEKTNKGLEADFDVLHKECTDARMFKERIESDLVSLKANGGLDEDGLQYLMKMLGDTVKLPEQPMYTALPLIPFDEDGKCEVTEFGDNVEINNLLIELGGYKTAYKKASEEEDKESAGKIEEEIKLKDQALVLAQENNKKCDAVDSFVAWSEADKKVAKLKREYAKLLASVDTGVDGLQIESLEEEGKLDIYLVYNGEYDPAYFGNPDKEYRKLSSYSGTQKPMICLLLQNYLLSKKAKAMRYLWIDNVPIDKKTRDLLERMGSSLNLTIFVNITGDFDRDSLDTGDILVVGGEVFFN